MPTYCVDMHQSDRPPRHSQPTRKTRLLNADVNALESTRRGAIVQLICYCIFELVSLYFLYKMLFGIRVIRKHYETYIFLYRLICVYKCSQRLVYWTNIFVTELRFHQHNIQVAIQNAR